MSMNFGMGYNPLVNPNITPQQRLMQYDHQMQLQQQMQPPMQMQQQIQSQALIKPFYVTSMQEAEASQTPFDGSIHLYLNTANNEIYTKKLKNDGSAEFKIYKTEIKEIIQEEKGEEAKSNIDLEPVISKLNEHDKTLKGIQTEIEKLNKYPINKNKKEVKTDD